MAVAESVPLLMRLVSSSVAVSYRAAKIARDVLSKGDLGIVEKGGKNDLQTEADRSAQRCIVASLHKQFPNIAIFGEEELAPTTKIPDDFFELNFDQEVLKHECPKDLKDVKNEEVVIWVDPLDGTKEFTEGFLDHVTVLIGIAVRGVATAGIINQPFYGYEEFPKYGKSRCIWGVKGLGSYGFERTPNLEGNIITTTRSHSDYTITKTVQACEPTEVLRVGGAGHKVLLLIEKKAHAYVFASIGCKKWDTCAPEAILHSVGGTLSDIHGKPIPYHANVVHKNTGGVLATVENHDWYVNKIKDNVDPETLAKFETVKPAPPTLEATLSCKKLNVNPQDQTDGNTEQVISDSNKQVVLESNEEVVSESAEQVVSETSKQADSEGSEQVMSEGSEQVDSELKEQEVISESCEQVVSEPVLINEETETTRL